LHAVNLQARSTVRGVATKKKWQCPLKNSLLRYLAVVYFFPSKTKKNKNKNEKMTEASALVCLALVTALIVLTV